MLSGLDPQLRVAGISLHCADPVALADFYQALLDGAELWRSERSIVTPGPGRSRTESPGTAGSGGRGGRSRSPGPAKLLGRRL